MKYVGGERLPPRAGPRIPRPGLAAGQALRAVGSMIGLITLAVTLSILYTPVRAHLYAVMAFSYGSSAATWSTGILQYIGYALMAVVVFRYLARLRPLVFAGQTPSRTTVRQTAFLVNLVICLILVNRVHVLTGKLSLPALIFDLVLGLLFSRHVKTFDQLLSSRDRLVLFIRPFSSFSDRSLLSGLLNRLPPGFRAVFLVPEAESLSRWDPYSLGVSGLRLLEPTASMPVAIVASNTDWDACVKALILRSSLILADVTRLTPSTLAELGFIGDYEACGKTLLFCERGASPSEVIPERRWLGFIDIHRRVNVVRTLTALAFLLTSWFLLPFWVLGTSPKRDLVGAVVLCLALLIVLPYWRMVFARRFVSSDVCQQALRLASGLIESRPPRFRRLLATAALLIVFWPSIEATRCLRRRFVVSGDVFPVTHTVTLVDGANAASGLAGVDPELVGVAYDWWMVPPKLGGVSSRSAPGVNKIEKEVRHACVRWFDKDPHLACGLELHFIGSVTTSPASPRGSMTMVFSLPQHVFGRVRGSLPRLVVDGLLRLPIDVDGAYLWPLGTWHLYGSRGEAQAAWLAAAARTIGTSVLIALALALVWRIVRT
jgi:hypothetical protein